MVRRQPRAWWLKQAAAVIGAVLILLGVASVFMPAAVILAGVFVIGLAIEVDK